MPLPRLPILPHLRHEEIVARWPRRYRGAGGRARRDRPERPGRLEHPQGAGATYVTHIQGGKFLVMVRRVPGAVERARVLRAHEDHEPEHMHLYETSPP
jgi:hypothetical protein